MATVKYVKKDLTKTVLETAAKDLNKSIPNLDPQIVIGAGTTVKKLMGEITDVVRDLLTTADKIAGKTKAVIAAMGLTIAESAGDETTDATDAVTVEQLEMAVADINTVLELDPAIPNEDHDQMKADIIEVASDKDGIKPGDELTAETRDLITALQTELDSAPSADRVGVTEDPDPDPDAETKAKKKADAAAKKKADTAAKKKVAVIKKTTGSPQSDKNFTSTRIAVTVETLKTERPTKVKDLIVLADNLFVTKGGTSNTATSSHRVSGVVATLRAANIIDVTNGNITRNDL